MTYHSYTQEQIAFVMAHLHLTKAELAAAFTVHFGVFRSACHIKALFGNRKIRSGRNSRFQKGNVPYNKGKKGVNGKSHTVFKKGDRPRNWRQVGSERISKDGYLEVKVAEPRTWRGKHLVQWESMHGPVPKGCAIIFADRNNRNFEPSNLVKVTRSELLFLNRKHLIHFDTDLTKTAVNIAKVAVKIQKARKGESSHAAK